MKDQKDFQKYDLLQKSFDNLFVRHNHNKGFNYIVFTNGDAKTGMAILESQSNSKYKIRINLDSKAFANNREEIINIIKSTMIEYKNIVSVFKFIEYSVNSVKYSDSAKIIDFWKRKEELRKLSIRQEQFNDSKEYIAAYDAKQVESLKKQLAVSAIYTTLQENIFRTKKPVDAKSNFFNKEPTAKKIQPNNFRRVPLSKELHQEIDAQIGTYKNSQKAEHIQKKAALTLLLQKINSQDLSTIKQTYTEIITDIIKQYPKSTSGIVSHRVLDLFEKIKQLDNNITSAKKIKLTQRHH